MAFLYTMSKELTVNLSSVEHNLKQTVVTDGKWSVNHKNNIEIVLLNFQSHILLK